MSKVTEEIINSRISGGRAMSPQEIVFKVTPEEAQILINGLGELPAKVSMALVMKLQHQASEQVQPSQEEPK